MGILTDAFIATNAEFAAASFEDIGGPTRFFPTVQGKNIEPFKLAILEAIVLGQNPDTEALDFLPSEPVREHKESWIFQVSETLIIRLAHLTDAEINHFGILWGSHQELWWARKAAPNPLTDTEYFAGITHYLQKLCQLAKQAQAEEKNVYMWVCL